MLDCINNIVCKLCNGASNKKNALPHLGPVKNKTINDSDINKFFRITQKYHYT